MDKVVSTSEHFGNKTDILTRENVALKKKPKPIAPPPVGQKLLTPAEIAQIQKVKGTTDVGPLSQAGTGAGAGAGIGAGAGAGAGSAKNKETETDEKTEKSGGLSSLLEGNNKYIVIAVALIAVYFLFIKKR